MSNYTIVSLFNNMSVYEFTKLCTKEDGSRLETPQVFNAMIQWYEEKHKAYVAERKMLKAIIDEKGGDCDELAKAYKALKAKSDALYAKYKKTKQEGKECKAKYAEYKAAYAEYKGKKAEYEAKHDELRSYESRYYTRSKVKMYNNDVRFDKIESAMGKLFGRYYERLVRPSDRIEINETQTLFMTEKDQLPGIMKVTINTEDNTAYVRAFVIIREDKD